MKNDENGSWSRLWDNETKGQRATKNKITLRERKRNGGRQKKDSMFNGKNQTIKDLKYFT